MQRITYVFLHGLGFLLMSIFLPDFLYPQVVEVSQFLGTDGMYMFVRDCIFSFRNGTHY